VVAQYRQQLSFFETVLGKSAPRGGGTGNGKVVCVGSDLPRANVLEVKELCLF
jgi:hypothetical protein